MTKQVWCDPEIDTEPQGCRGIILGVAIGLAIWLVFIVGFLAWVSP